MRWGTEEGRQYGIGGEVRPWCGAVGMGVKGR
jgi:hypothetical protein